MIFEAKPEGTRVLCLLPPLGFTWASQRETLSSLSYGSPEKSPRMRQSRAVIVCTGQSVQGDSAWGQYKVELLTSYTCSTVSSGTQRGPHSARLGRYPQLLSGPKASVLILLLRARALTQLSAWLLGEAHQTCPYLHPPARTSTGSGWGRLQAQGHKEKTSPCKISQGRQISFVQKSV